MRTIDQEIGERVHRLMWRQRVSQVHLATVLGVTQGAISKKVHGERPWFASELLDVARTLNVHVSALLSGLDDDDPGGPAAAVSLPRLDSNQQPFDHWSVDVA